MKNTLSASVFSLSTECHNQDKVSMGTIAARDAIRVQELTEQLAAASLLASNQGLWEVLVPFFDIDIMNVVWHGHYVKYLEVARGAVFGQRLNVRASLVEWENRLKINYLISDAQTGERLTRAMTVQVAVEIASREMQLASPHVFVDAVQRALP